MFVFELDTMSSRGTYQRIENLEMGVENISLLTNQSVNYGNNNKNENKMYWKFGPILFLISSIFALFYLASNASMNNEILGQSQNSGSNTGDFDWAGRYILKDFDKKKPMANFLPGLGGYWGVLTIFISLTDYLIKRIFMLRNPNVVFLCEQRSSG